MCLSARYVLAPGEKPTPDLQHRSSTASYFEWAAPRLFSTTVRALQPCETMSVGGHLHLRSINGQPVGDTEEKRPAQEGDELQFAVTI